jgi:hypothetical membrane protein
MSTSMQQSLARPSDSGVAGRRRADGTLARISVLAFGGFAAAVLVAGRRTPGYSHRSEAISALGARDAAAPEVMLVGFLLLAAALLSAGVVLARTIAGKAGRVGALLVCLAGVAAVITAFAQEDCSDLKAACAARERAGTVSGEHVLHNLVGLILFTALVIGLFFLAAGLRRATSRSSLARVTQIVALAALGFMVWFGSDAYGDNGGLVQRALILLACGWPALLASGLGRAFRP